MHLNHNIRGKEAKRDEDFVRNLRRNIPTYIYSENIEEDAKKAKESVETYARKRRYILMNNILKEKIEGKTILEKRFSGGIITAHNANDNAETIFMNMLRGSRKKTD